MAEGFLREGHSVRLVLNKKDTLNRPESKFLEFRDNYPSWILDGTLMKQSSYVPDLPDIETLLTELSSFKFEVVILNDRCVSLARFFTVPVISFLTGSDLTKYASTTSMLPWKLFHSVPNKKNPRLFNALAYNSRFVFEQMFGIFSSDLVSYALPEMDTDGDLLLNYLAVPLSKRIMIYMSDTYNLKPQPLRFNSKLKLFCGARVTFNRREGKLTNYDLKGTNILLKGFSQFLQNGGDGILELVEKGDDIEEAKKLILDLNITDNVVWLKEMTLAQFYEKVVLADIVCDQFGDSFPGMVTLDSLALGRPVMSNLRNEIFEPYFGQKIPGLNVTSADRICEVLSTAYADRDILRRLSSQSRKFAEEFLAPEAAVKIIISKLQSL